MRAPHVVFKRALIVALVLAFAALYATPWLALHELRQAAAAQDDDRLAELVDFPRLRENIKLGLLDQLAGSGQDEPTHARQLGAAVAGALLGPMVDAAITPRNLGLLLEGHRLGGKGASLSPAPDGAPQALVQHGHYESLNRFVYSVRRAVPADDEPIEFVFERDGLIGWKLAELRLP